MKRVKIADLKNNLSRHLVYVRDGGAVVVLDRETPIARILPFVPADAPGRPAGSGRDEYWTDERLAELERQGVHYTRRPAGQCGLGEAGAAGEAARARAATHRRAPPNAA